MQTASSIESKKLARWTDPLTSHDAAARVGDFGVAQCARILAALKKLGKAGAEEIAAEINLGAYQVRKRIASLHDAGRVNLTGDTRKTSTGRTERIWIASEGVDTRDQ